MRIISIANQKGGCGKTTTAINLSACLALKGRKVLLIDMDPQGHSGMGLGIHIDELEKNVHDSLYAPDGTGVPLANTSVLVSENFSIAPSNINLSSFEQKMSMLPGRESKLKQAIEGLESNYDYILIDSPPSLGLLTFNALMASTEVFIPIEMGLFSLQGTGKLLEIIELVRSKTGHEMRIKVIPTMYDKRTSIAKEVLENIRTHFSSSMFNAVINSNVRLREAAGFGKSIADYDRRSRGYEDYLSLAEEVLEEERTLKTSEDHKPERPSMQAFESARRFVIHAPQANLVRLVGSFNNWVPTEDYLLERSDDGYWAKTIYLPPGEHHYKFIVDGLWVEDETNPDIAHDPYGGRNSVMLIG